MFDIKELEFIKGVLEESESQDKMTLSIIEKIDDVVKKRVNAKNHYGDSTGIVGDKEKSKDYLRLLKKK